MKNFKKGEGLLTFCATTSSGCTKVCLERYEIR